MTNIGSHSFMRFIKDKSGPIAGLSRQSNVDVFKVVKLECEVSGD